MFRLPWAKKEALSEAHFARSEAERTQRLGEMVRSLGAAEKFIRPINTHLLTWASLAHTQTFGTIPNSEAYAQFRALDNMLFGMADELTVARKLAKELGEGVLPRAILDRFSIFINICDQVQHPPQDKAGQREVVLRLMKFVFTTSAIVETDFEVMCRGIERASSIASKKYSKRMEGA